jgi:hypothetical protein
LALLVGLVVGIAVGVGIGALVFNSDDNGGSSSVNTKAIALPDSLGGFRDVNAVYAAHNPGATALKAQATRVASTRKLTEVAYANAFGGASAAYRQYADQALEKMPFVIAVRASAPRLTIGPVVDPASLEQGANNRDTRTMGQVTCEINREDFTPKGQEPDPSKEHVTLCERTGPKATVFVGGSGFVGAADFLTMVNITDSVFNAVAGG